MDENQWLADRFEEHRPHLRAVGYRMLGSLTEADIAVPKTWLRLSRSSDNQIENLGGWLTTVIGRVCLNMLLARNIRREESLEVHVADPVALVAVLDPDVVVRIDGGAERPAASCHIGSSLRVMSMTANQLRRTRCSSCW